MPKFTIEDLRLKFSKSTDFNEIFDAFEDALEQRLQDVELYRLLFWNHALTPDELCLFGEKLAREFPNIAYDVYMWLASVFEVTYSSYDNYDLCIEYYKKAAHVKPGEIDPYLDACDCYEPDLKIPPIDILIEFVKRKPCTLGSLTCINLRVTTTSASITVRKRKRAAHGQANHPKRRRNSTSLRKNW